MKARWVTTTELILKGLMAFSVLTVLQGISFFDDINKVAIAVITMILACHLLTMCYTKMQYIVLMLTMIVHIGAIVFTDFPLVNINTLFYFMLWVLIYMFFVKAKDKTLGILERSHKYIKGVLWCWTLLVGVSVFMPSSYQERYFLSFSGTSFRLMPTVLIVAALSMYMVVATKKGSYNWFLLLPTYAAFMNQSRTYFAVYLLFLMMYIYTQFKSKRNFYIMLLPMSLVVLALMSFSGIADKILSALYNENSYFDFWGTITSGRTVFWKADLEAFWGLPVWQQFVGNGFNFVYEVNSSQIAANIWAHNDIINLLMNFGYIGVFIYCWVYYKMLKVFWSKGSNIPFFTKMMFHLAVFVNSMFNMSYTYLCAVIAYPFFLCVLSTKYSTADINRLQPQ